jgi:hypothetical protein
VITEFPLPTPIKRTLRDRGGGRTAASGSGSSRQSDGPSSPPPAVITGVPAPTPGSTTALGDPAGRVGSLWFTEVRRANRIGRITGLGFRTVAKPVQSPLPVIPPAHNHTVKTNPPRDTCVANRWHHAAGLRGRPIVEIQWAGAGGDHGRVGDRTRRPAARSGVVGHSLLGAGSRWFGGGSLVARQYVGTNVAGTVALGNADAWLLVASANNTIGGWRRRSPANLSRQRRRRRPD